MYKIDLLKGQGIPHKSRPEPIAAATLTVAIPVIVSIIIFTIYYANNINISNTKRQISQYQKELSSGKLADVSNKRMLIEQEITTLSQSLSEVSSAIGGQMQWTALLEAVVNEMPATIILRSADVKKDSKKVKVAKADEKNKMVDTLVPIRILHLSLTASQQSGFGQAIETYRNNLRSNPDIGPRLDDIRVAREFSYEGGRNVETYEIYMEFKPLM